MKIRNGACGTRRYPIKRDRRLAAISESGSAIAGLAEWLMRAEARKLEQEALAPVSPLHCALLDVYIPDPSTAGVWVQASPATTAVNSLGATYDKWRSPGRPTAPTGVNAEPLAGLPERFL